MYRGYFSYYDEGGLTKHKPAGPKRRTYDDALMDLIEVHPIIEGWVPAGNYVKEIK